MEICIHKVIEFPHRHLPIHTEESHDNSPSVKPQSQQVF
jgi:hypothetical protein